MIAFAPLLAAGIEELIKVLILLAVILIPAIGKLLSMMKEGQQGGAGQQRPGGPARPGGRAQAGGQRPPRKGVEDEIGEFLRRAAQGRRGAPQAQAPPPQQAPPPRPPKPAFKPLAQPVEELVPVEVVREAPTGQDVAQHVSKYLDPSEMDRHARSLGADVDQADDRLVERLHQTFDHEVSRLGIREYEPPEEADSGLKVLPSGTEVPPAAAAGFAALLSDGASVQQAIVLNEILRRPEERWG